LDGSARQRLPPLLAICAYLRHAWSSPSDVWKLGKAASSKNNQTMSSLAPVSQNQADCISLVHHLPQLLILEYTRTASPSPFETLHDAHAFCWLADLQLAAAVWLF
jgi:hypothetical protein